MRTVLEVVRLSTTYLGEHGSGTPRLDAELLAAHALGIGRIDLYLQHDRPLADADLTAIRSLVGRRGRGEPVAHMTGAREFYGRPFLVSPAVLIPRPDTETLVEQTLAWARSTAGEVGEGQRIADIGTGSGCIGCTLAAELPGCTVVASDVSPEALGVASANATRLGVADRVSFAQGSWGKAFEPGSAFDVVVSNPPYVTRSELEGLDRDVRDFEPRLALDGGTDGLAPYREIAEAAAGMLRPSGLLAVEVDPRRAAAIADLMEERLPGLMATPVNDLSGRPRVLLISDRQPSERPWSGGEGPRGGAGCRLRHVSGRGGEASGGAGPLGQGPGDSCHRGQDQRVGGDQG